MIGRELAAQLEIEGFTIVRRSQAYVWLGRGKDVLLVDLEAEVPDDVAHQLIHRARTPSS